MVLRPSLKALDFKHTFKGGGPTIDFEATRRIGQTNFAFYGNCRASLLVGRSNETTSYSQIVNDPRGLTNGGAFPFNSTNSPTATNSSDNVMPVTEIELGLEYGRDCGRMYWFARATAVNQTYFSASATPQAATETSACLAGDLRSA